MRKGVGDYLANGLRHVTNVFFASLLSFVPACSEEKTEIGATVQPQLRNGFDLSEAIIPIDEILFGGPPRDGIPSIDAPVFIKPDSVDFLRDDDLVISFSVGETTRAYPIRILVKHEIVNDQIGGKSLAITYCPLCGTAMVFDRNIGGRTLSFGVSGLLYQSDVLMFDRETDSLWSQLKMQAVSGQFANTLLDWLPSEHLTWAAWKQMNPDGEVLSTQTGHQRDYERQPYGGYEQNPNTMYPVPHVRHEFPNKEWILGITIGGTAKAYPLSMLQTNWTVVDIVGGLELKISYDPLSKLATVASVNGQQPIPSVKAYWFAWQAFHPETQIWTP